MNERIWMILTTVLLIVAGVFMWRGNLSAGFVTATLGAVAWFLSYRSQLRANIANDREDDVFDEEKDEN